MGKSKSWILGLLFGLIFSSAHAAVWKTTRQWDDAADAQFTTWIRNLPLDIFLNPSSKYAGIATDCADAVYFLRIIFAYENGLPVRFQNDPELSNENTRFDSLSNRGEVNANGVKKVSPRLKAFMRWVGDATNTQSLSWDTYPVAINQTSMRAGFVFLHASSEGQEEVPVTYRSGHVYYLQNIYENGFIRYIGSTVPLATRALSARMGISFAPQETDSGYRAWKRPYSDAQPFYSEEQFQLAGWYQHSFKDGKMWDRWQDAIQSRFRTRLPTAGEMLQAAQMNLKAALQERAYAVTDGWRFYRNNYSSGQCMSSSDYDDYSTPTRDTKIQYELRNYRIAARNYLESRESNEVWSTLNMRRPGQVTDRFLSSGDPLAVASRSERGIQEYYKWFTIEVMSGVKLNYLELWRAFMTEYAYQISEPEHSPEVRWGLRVQGQWPCPERRKQYSGGSQQ